VIRSPLKAKWRALARGFLVAGRRAAAPAHRTMLVAVIPYGEGTQPQAGEGYLLGLRFSKKYEPSLPGAL
jgi:hypothetical protein